MRTTSYSSGWQRLSLHIRAKLVKDVPVGQFLKKLVKWSWILLLVASILQILIFSTYQNIIAVFAVMIAWLATSKIFLHSDNLNNYPLSSFLVIGFTATQLYFPLIFTLLEYKPVIYNLEMPLEVFFHSIAALSVLIAAHFVYRLIPVNKQRNNSSILKRIGLFQPPSELQFWFMGLIGMIANVYVFFFSPAIATEVSGNAADKAILALLPFTYAPYFIPFKQLYNGSGSSSKNMVTLLIMYTIVLFVISMARNSRGAFMIGFTSVGFSYLLGLLIGFFKAPKISYKSVILCIASFWLLTGPMADLGTAMVLVRDQRSDISKAELIDLTLKAFKNKNAIILRRLQDNGVQGDWDERYLNNIFTARFANLKFNDISLVQARIVGDNNEAMRKFSIDYVWGALPTPILKLFNPAVDKEMVYSTSFGDYLYSLAGAGSDAYGGFRTGHFAGTGMAAFGFGYLWILCLGMIPVYYLFDKLVFIKSSNNMAANKTQHKPLYFSACGLLALTSIFQYLPTESVVAPATFILRGWIQMVLLYFVMFQVTRFICVFFFNNQQRAIANPQVLVF